MRMLNEPKFNATKADVAQAPILSVLDSNVYENVLEKAYHFAKNEMQIVDFKFDKDTCPRVYIDNEKEPKEKYNIASKQPKTKEQEEKSNDLSNVMFSTILGKYFSSSNSITLYAKNIKALDKYNYDKLLEVVLVHELFHAYHFNKIKTFITDPTLKYDELANHYWVRSTYGNFDDEITNQLSKELSFTDPFKNIGALANKLVQESLATAFQYKYALYLGQDDLEYKAIADMTIKGLDPCNVINCINEYNGNLKEIESIFPYEGAPLFIDPKYVDEGCVSRKFRQVLNVSVFNFAFANNLMFEKKDAVTLVYVGVEEDVVSVELLDNPYLLIDKDLASEEINNIEDNHEYVGIDEALTITFTHGAVPLYLFIRNFNTMTTEEILRIDFNFNLSKLAYRYTDFLLFNGKALTEIFNVYNKLLLREDGYKLPYQLYTSVNCPNLINSLSKQPRVAICFLFRYFPKYLLSLSYFATIADLYYRLEPPQQK